MERRRSAVVVATVLGILAPPAAVLGAPLEVAPLEGARADALAAVTGYHALRHKKSRLFVRLLEVDGSATVAHDPIALVLVVTNDGGNSDDQGHVWELPRGVARVRSLSETACGVNVRVEVDGPDEPTPDDSTQKVVPRTLGLCFLSKEGRLRPKLELGEGAR
jgi:hypothetical protein